MDANLMHISYESGILEDPSIVPPAGIFKMTVDPENAADAKDEVVVSFKKGETSYFLYGKANSY